MLKVLGREEPFKLSVRRGANVLRKARDSTLLLLPPIEVRMTEDLANEFRAKGAALARAKTEGYVGVYFGLSTTLATRIRSEVVHC